MSNCGVINTVFQLNVWKQVCFGICVSTFGSVGLVDLEADLVLGQNGQNMAPPATWRSMIIHKVATGSTSGSFVSKPLSFLFVFFFLYFSGNESIATFTRGRSISSKFLYWRYERITFFLAFFISDKNYMSHSFDKVLNIISTTSYFRKI